MSIDPDSPSYGAQVTPPTKVTPAGTVIASTPTVEVVDLTGPAAQQQYAPTEPTPTPVPANYYDEEPVYVDKPALIKSGAVTPPTPVSPAGTVIESTPTVEVVDLTGPAAVQQYATPEPTVKLTEREK
jgi:hypothetical protein